MLRMLFVLLCLLMNTSFAVSGQAQSIAPKYQEGERHLYNMEFQLDMTQKVKEPEQANVQYNLSIGTGAEISVKEVRDDRTANLMVKLIKPSMRFSIKNKESENDLFNLSYDSTDESTPILPPFQYITPVAKCLDGAEFMITLDVNGRISEIHKISRLRDKMDEELSTSLPEDLKSQICSSIQSEIILGVIAYFTNYLPDHQVKLGESWTGAATPFGIGDKDVWTLSKFGEDKLRLEKSYTVTEGQMDSLIGGGIFKKANASAHESIHLDKESFIVLSNVIDVSTEAHQKMPLPDGRNLDATYQVKGQFSLQKQ